MRFWDRAGYKCHPQFPLIGAIVHSGAGHSHLLRRNPNNHQIRHGLARYMRLRGALR